MSLMVLSNPSLLRNLFSDPSLTLALLSLFVLSDSFALNDNAYCANPLISHHGTIWYVCHVPPGDVCAYYALSSLASAADPIGEILTCLWEQQSDAKLNIRTYQAMQAVLLW